MVAMIVFTSEGDISCLESTVDHAESECQKEMTITAAILSTLDTVNRCGSLSDSPRLSLSSGQMQ